MPAIQNLKNYTGDILIVDDSIVDLQLLTEMLKRQDFQVRPFENPQLAIESALSRPPYLILLEAGMPKMDGFEVCQLLKQDERTRDIPIIFVSARTEEDERIKCYKAGGVDFISKPFQETEVLARVRTHTKLHNMQLNLEKLVAKHGSGKPVFIESVFRDTTKLKEAEEKLRESEKRFSDVANNALDWIWEVDSKGKYTYVSPVVEKVLGYKPEEMLQKHFYDLLYPDDHKEKLKREAFEMFARKEPFREFINRNAHKNGKEVWLSTSGVPLLDKKGELVGYRGTDRDITERKEGEKKLKKSEEKYRTVLENIPDVIWTSDNKGNTVFISPKIKEIYGYSPEEIYEQGEKLWFERIHPDDVENVKHAFGSLFDTPNFRYDVEYRIRNKEEEWIWLNDRSISTYKKGGVSYADGILTDVTVRKKAEAFSKKNESRFNTIYENAPFLIDAFDENGKCLMWNKECEKLFGWTAEEIFSHEKPLMLLYPDPKVQSQVVETVTSKPEKVFREWKPKKKDGSELTCLWANFKLPDGLIINLGYDMTGQKQAEANLIKSKTRYRELVNNSLVGVFETTIKGEFKFANDALARMYDFDSPEQMITLGTLPRWVDLRQREQLLAELQEHGSVKNFEIKTVTHTGRFIHVLMSAKLNAGIISGMVMDISDRKHAEKKLRDSEREKDLVLDNTNEIIAYHSLGHMIQWANKAYLKESGLSLSELKEQTCYQLRGLDSPCKNCPVTKAIQTGEPQETELSPLNQEHRSFNQGYWLIRAAPVNDDFGKTIGAIEVAYDITERMQGQKALERSRASLAKAQEITHTGSWQLDVLKGELLWSDEIHRIFNVARDIPMTYNKFMRSIHPEDKTFVEESWMEAFKNEPHVIEYRIIAANRVKWVSEQIEVKFKKEGELLFAVGIIQDITERKESEEELREIKSELLHSTRNRTVVELTAALAHELNHPLGSILNNANAARRYLSKKKPDFDEIRAIIDDIISEDRRASDVMQRVRALMKHSQIELFPIKINIVIEDVLKLTQSDLIIKNVLVSKQLGNNLPTFEGDYVQLQQVFLNLIINAADAMHGSKMKKIQISTAKQDSKNIIVCVRDSGTGFDEKDKDKLFDPFFTTKKDGMGMGLSVVKTIVKAHGGDIWVENNEKRGASFFVRFQI